MGSAIKRFKHNISAQHEMTRQARSRQANVKRVFVESRKQGAGLIEAGQRMSAAHKRSVGDIKSAEMTEARANVRKSKRMGKDTNFGENKHPSSYKKPKVMGCGC